MRRNPTRERKVIIRTPIKGAYGQAVLKKKVQVWWSGDNCWFTGVVKQYNATSGEHGVAYEDGDFKWHDLKHEEIHSQLKWLDEPAAIKKPKLTVEPANIIEKKPMVAEKKPAVKIEKKPVVKPAPSASAPVKRGRPPGSTKEAAAAKQAKLSAPKIPEALPSSAVETSAAPGKSGYVYSPLRGASHAAADSKTSFNSLVAADDAEAAETEEEEDDDEGGDLSSRRPLLHPTRRPSAMPAQPRIDLGLDAFGLLTGGGFFMANGKRCGRSLENAIQSQISSVAESAAAPTASSTAGASSSSTSAAAVHDPAGAGRLGQLGSAMVELGFEPPLDAIGLLWQRSLDKHAAPADHAAAIAAIRACCSSGARGHSIPPTVNAVSLLLSLARAIGATSTTVADADRIMLKGPTTAETADPVRARSLLLALAAALRGGATTSAGAVGIPAGVTFDADMMRAAMSIIVIALGSELAAARDVAAAGIDALAASTFLDPHGEIASGWMAAAWEDGWSKLGSSSSSGREAASGSSMRCADARTSCQS